MTMLVGLSACESDTHLTITTDTVKLSINPPQDPISIQTFPVTMRVLNKENINDFLKEISQTQGENPVFIGFTFKDYENLILNLSDIKRYIEQQQAIIIYYRNVSKN